MVYEWVRRDTPNENATVSFSCNSGVAIAKGTLLALMDESRVGAHSAAAQAIAGVAAAGKSASDYSTTIAVWQDGIYEATASGACILGYPIQAAAQANTFDQANTTSGAIAFGYCLGTAAAAEVVNVRLTLA